MRSIKLIFLLPLVVMILDGCKKNEPGVQDAIHVYPNPARELVSIETNFPKPGTVTLELIGDDNKPLFSTMMAQNANQTFDITNYPNGVYKIIGTQADGTKSITTLYIQRPKQK